MHWDCIECESYERKLKRQLESEKEANKKLTDKLNTAKTLQQAAMLAVQTNHTELASTLLKMLEEVLA